MKNNNTKSHIRCMVVTAVMSAISFVLMMLEFSVPFTPEFLKFDFSDLPALITSFAIGPLWGVIVELIKNLLHMPLSHTSFVGEFANLLVSIGFVLPSGIIYNKMKTRSGALIGAAVGTVLSALVSYPINYFIAYPFYFTFMPEEAIISMYSAVIPAANTLEKALLIVNMPFTLIKGAVSASVTFLLYKKLSPILHGQKKGNTDND